MLEFGVSDSINASDGDEKSNKLVSPQNNPKKTI